MRRRRFLLSATAASWVGPALAQATPRIGFLVAGDPEPAWSMFKAAMAGAGYEVGRNLQVDFRQADAGSARLNEYAAELVKLRGRAIVAILSPAVTAARKATDTIPIVSLGGAPDIVGVTNHARPEGNITGVYHQTTFVAGKAIQLFFEAAPAARRMFGLVLNAADPFYLVLKRDLEAATASLKIDLVQALLKSRDELDAACALLVSKGVSGALMQPTIGFEAAATAALKHRLPAISFRREFPAKGGLMGYGGNFVDLNRIAAGQVERILKGAAVNSIPYEQSTRYELVVNQTTARTLGFTFPPAFMARVDEVIE